jgi:hypothetical protein
MAEDSPVDAIWWDPDKDDGDVTLPPPIEDVRRLNTVSVRD